MMGDSLYIDSGVGLIPAGQEDLLDPIQINFPANYTPIITVTPYRPAEGTGYEDEDANINIHLFTRLEFDTDDDVWKFNVRRSIGENLVEDGGIESMSFMWKAIGVRSPKIIGNNVETVTEPAS